MKVIQKSIYFGKGATHGGGAKLPRNQKTSDLRWTCQDYQIWYFKKFILTMVTNVTKNILCFTDKHKVLQKVLQTNELGLTT